MLIRRRKWGWIGPLLRKPPTNSTRRAQTWNPQFKRKRGRPRNTWRRDTESELREHDTTWQEAAKAAQNRVCRRTVVDDLYIPHRTTGLTHTDEKSETERFCSNIYAFHRKIFRPDRSMSNPQNGTSANEEGDFTSTIRSMGESRMNMTIGQQAESQAKFCQDRVSNTEKYLGSLCEVMGSITRKTARIRDKGDMLAKICKDYSDEEKVSHSLKAGLRSCAENLSIIQDYRHAQVQRMESKVVRPISDYGNICKQIRAGVKRELDAVKREDKKKTELQKLRSKSPGNAHQISRAQSDVERAREEASIGSKHLEEQMVTFEKRRLHDVKAAMLDYLKVQLVFHAKAIEFYSKCFESMSMVDEERDLQEFQRTLSMAKGGPDIEDISHALTSMTTTNGYSDTLGSTDPYTSTYESTASDHRRVRISKTSTMYGDDDDDDDDDYDEDDDEYDLSTAR